MKVKIPAGVRQDEPINYRNPSHAFISIFRLIYTVQTTISFHLFYYRVKM